MSMNGTSAAGESRRDLYELLEVSPRASAEVIRAAYHVLARSHHPDVNPGSGAARRMRQINAAYTVLSDPVQRAAYDAQGSWAARAARQRRADGCGSRPRAEGAPEAGAGGEPQGRRPSGRRGRVRAEVRCDLEPRRALLTPLGRTVLVGLIMTVVVALSIGLWAVFEALDSGWSRVTPISDAGPGYFVPLAGADGPLGASSPR